MEKPSFENNGQENLEKIKEELCAQWDKIFHGLVNSNPSAKKSFKEAEFKKIMSIYEAQGRSESQYKNLMLSLEDCQSDFEKLSQFYNNIAYNRNAAPEQNKESSLKFAEQFLDMLEVSQEKKKEFKKYF